MSSGRLYLIRFLIFFLPETRAFGLKRWLYKWAGISVGNNVRFCSSAFITGTGNIKIGDNTWVGHHVVIISTSEVNIGKDVDIAPNVFIGTGSHQIDVEGNHIAGKGTSLPIRVGDGSWLGVGSILLPGTVLGEKSIVAAGAVVKGNFESYSMIGGIPAKLIKKIN